MSYNDSFVTLNYDKYVIVTHTVLKLRGGFIKDLVDVRLSAIKEEAAKCRGFPVGETSWSRFLTGLSFKRAGAWTVCERR